MVSTTTFNPKCTIPTPNAILPPTPAVMPGATAGATVYSGFKYNTVAINDVAVTNLPDLFRLGASRHSPTSPTAPTAAEEAYTSDDLFKNDQDYFKALLAAREEIHKALQNKILGLQGLRKRNKRMARRRASNRVVRSVSAEATGLEAGGVVDEPANVTGQNPSISTGSGLMSAQTSGVGASQTVQAEGWHGHAGTFVAICSSPVSMDEDGNTGAGAGGKKKEKKDKQEMDDGDMGGEKNVSYRA